MRNPGHDPMFGLLFAVADIILGTATVIDNDGKLRVIVRSKDYPPQEKNLSVIYYLTFESESYDVSVIPGSMSGAVTFK